MSANFDSAGAGVARRVKALATLAAGVVVAFSGASANATGTARIQQSDGSRKTYTNVRIVIRNESMAMTTSDGEGTLVLGKAACTKVGELFQCLPYDATLFQHGERTHIPLRSGAVWVNLTQTSQQLTYSSMHVPPRGVLLAVQTNRGTYVTLTGVIDEIVK